MKTSREQFEEWYFKRYGDKDLTVVRNHAEFCDALEVWQASRQCIEVELPDEEDPADCFCNVFAVDDVIYQIKQAGIKVKGA